jgi:hypothetical protein
MTAAHSHEPLVLYSTVTWLAYAIAEQYYGGNHYVWCTRYFDPSAVPSIDYTVPPSSSPAEIYQGILEDVRRGDKHSAKIEANRAGILRGAQLRAGLAQIDGNVLSEITSIVTGAEIRDFLPLVLVIPYALAKPVLSAVPVSKRAHPMSIEFTIDRLSRTCFDVIQFTSGGRGV